VWTMRFTRGCRSPKSGPPALLKVLKKTLSTRLGSKVSIPWSAREPGAKRARKPRDYPLFAPITKKDVQTHQNKNKTRRHTSQHAAHNNNTPLNARAALLSLRLERTERPFGKWQEKEGARRGWVKQERLDGAGGAGWSRSEEDDAAFWDVSPPASNPVKGQARIHSPC
jgi:hypothetical protein